MLTRIGEVQAQQGNYDKALSYFERCLVLCREIGNRRQEVELLTQIGKVQLTCNNLESTLFALLQALPIAHSLLDDQLSGQVHALLYVVYKRKGQFEQALFHHEHYHKLSKKIRQDRTREYLSLFKMNYKAKLQAEAERRRQAESDLQQTTQRLKHETAEHQRVVADLDSYTYMVAHDLKAPIAVIMGYAQLLLQDLALEEISNQAQWLKAVEDACNKMNQITDELLTMAKVNTQDLDLEIVDMERIVLETQKQLKPIIEQKNGVIRTATDIPDAMGYAPWVEQVWANYLTNALKYGGSPPMITIGATPQGDMIRYWVKDNGDGMDAEFQKDAFTAFKRSKTHRHIQGIGVGLSIVKRIIEKLGGQVAVESANIKGQGSTFSFTLPIVKEHIHVPDPA